ncbi:MAG: hypothetical protein K9L59_09080 [Desulfobacterales bacterium]|nr:hypothetical protein [Desulfobacterales bacterium]
MKKGLLVLVTVSILMLSMAVTAAASEDGSIADGWNVNEWMIQFRDQVDRKLVSESEYRLSFSNAGPAGISVDSISQIAAVTIYYYEYEYNENYEGRYPVSYTFHIGDSGIKSELLDYRLYIGSYTGCGWMAQDWYPAKDMVFKIPEQLFESGFSPGIQWEIPHVGYFEVKLTFSDGSVYQFPDISDVPGKEDIPAIDPKSLKVDYKHEDGVIVRWDEIDPAVDLCGQLTIFLFAEFEKTPTEVPGLVYEKEQEAVVSVPAHMNYVFVPNRVVDELKAINPNEFQLLYMISKQPEGARKLYYWEDKVRKWKNR